MGVLGAAGVFNARLVGLATHTESHTDRDFNSHFGTGLTKFIDPHIRNDRFPANPRTVAIFQFKDVTSKNGMSGFSPLIESKTPTRSGDAKRITTPVSFSTALANSQAFFNQAYITTRENTWWRAAQRSSSRLPRGFTRLWRLLQRQRAATAKLTPLVRFNLLGGAVLPPDR
jgi:hypothetical protein